MKKIISFLFMMSAATVANAQSELIQDRIITDLVVYDDKVVVKVSPSFSNSQGCSSSSTTNLQVNYNSETGENMALFSTLLATATSSKPVGLRISGCAGQYPEIYRIDVKY